MIIISYLKSSGLVDVFCVTSVQRAAQPTSVQMAAASCGQGLPGTLITKKWSAMIGKPISAFVLCQSTPPN